MRAWDGAEIAGPGKVLTNDSKIIRSRAWQLHLALRTTYVLLCLYVSLYDYIHKHVVSRRYPQLTGTYYVVPVAGE